jgi:hypothetical protein
MRGILKLVVRVAVDAMILDLYHSFERAALRRLKKNRQENWGG